MEDILVVAATKTELPPIKGAVKTGLGKEKTRRTILELLKTRRPTQVISVGLVGAVVPELKVGDIFIPETIIDYETMKRYYLREGRRGTLVTVPKVFERDDKYRLKEIIPDATCVDMETSAVAEVLEQFAIPLLCIKVVSDELDFDVSSVELLNNNIKKALDNLHMHFCKYPLSLVAILQTA